MAVRLWKFAVSYSTWCLLLLLTFTCSHPASGLEISDSKVVADSAGKPLANRQFFTETVITGGDPQLPATSTPSAQTPSSVASFAVPTNVLPVKDFIRRVYARVAVIRDYIYLDSGEVAQQNTGTGLLPVNGTLAIDLRTTWIPEEVEIINNEYEDGPDGKQVLLSAALMVNEPEGSIYTWGGRTSLSEPIREEPELWKFQPTSEGRGEWTDATPSGSDFTSRKRSKDAAVASTQKMAFVFGGISDRETTREAVGSIDGFTTFEFETGKWEYHKAGPYSKDRIIVGGSAVFARNIGDHGVIFVLGGTNDPDALGEKREDYVSFKTIHFLDPVTMKWYKQETSGEEPAGRRYFCAVGAAVGEDGFDIFIYGGRSESPATEYSDVHVLSLPGFHWTRAPVDPNVDRERCDHACAVIGNKQLMSWGGSRGVAGSRGTEAGVVWYEIPDAFPQGIGLFDMTILDWTTRYNPDATAYQRHESIAKWYQEGGVADWDPEARDLIVKGSNTSSPDAGVGGGGAGGPPIGPIVGGVVGGVLVIAAIVGILWFLRRRKRRQAEQAGVGVVPAAYDHASPPPAEVANSQWKSGTHGYEDYPVNTGTEQPSELHAGSPTYQQPSEMDGTEFYRQGR